MYVKNCVINILQAPEFYYQCLERSLKMNLVEILTFTDALENLQKLGMGSSQSERGSDIDMDKFI